MTTENFNLVLSKATNVLDGIKCNEPADDVCLDKMMKNDLLTSCGSF
jgi:hypothetical protein